MDILKPKPGKSVVAPIKGISASNVSASFFKGANLSKSKQIKFLQVCKFIEKLFHFFEVC